MKRRKATVVARIFALLVVIGVIFGAGLFSSNWIKVSKSEKKSTVLGEKQDKYIDFIDEVYDKIKENYWEKITDQELSNTFALAIEKLVKQPTSLKTQDKEGVNAAIMDAMKIVDPNKKKDFMAGLADMVLANLKPFGRSRLYSQKEEKSLSNTVNNINPGADHFEALGVGKSASDKEIAAAFEKKSKELESSKSADAQQKLAEVKQAYEVLKEKDSRQVYETSGVEPTIEYKLLSPSIFYMHLTKFSPTSLEEFARDTAKVDSGTTLDTLIWDLRGNIGGQIDLLPYFLGPFIGPDQYAYQFYHQGNKEDFKTRTGWLNSLIRYKKVIVLIDNQTQSSAEVMASVLKKYNVGLVMGTTSKGWGTVERVIPLDHQMTDDEKFSLFMVHRVTLREDGTPIEGQGVQPVIDVTKAEWKTEFLKHYNNPDLAKAIDELYKK